MKKTLSIIGIAALTLVACNKEPEGIEYPTPEAGQKYVFEGTVATDGFTWDNTSTIGIYGLTDGVRLMNEEAKIEGWVVPNDTVDWTPSPYAGKETAPFTTTNGIDLVKGPNEFLVYSPYDPEMSYIPSLGQIYDLSVSASQTQKVANVAGGCFALGKVKGIPAKDEKFTFSLNPITALLKINVSSTEFAQYGLRKITISDPAGNAKIGGAFDVNVNTLEFSPTSSFSTIATTISAVSPLGSGTQSIFMNILPGDYSSLDFSAIVELSGEKGNVTMPIVVKGVKCEAGKTAEINIADLKSSDNAYAWYCPVESRKLVGSAYAYGDQNTYLIQSKTAVYAGTLTPNADIPQSVTIDYRLRGDFTKAEIPEGVTFEWATKANGSILTTRTDGKVVSDDYTFEPDPQNYTVTVKCGAATTGAPILLMKKDGKILWGWSFWNIAADGTALSEVAVGTHKLANLNIGQATDNYDAYAASAAANINRSIHLYQFGRYLPVFWDSYWTTSYYAIAPGADAMVVINETPTPYPTAGNVTCVVGPFKTLQESLQYPYGAITIASQGASAVIENWCEEGYGDLWGGVVGKDTEPGTKSIYDPCPKGWRVPDKAALEDVLAALPSPLTQSDYIWKTGELALKVGSTGLILPLAGYIDFKKVDAKAATDFRVTNYGATTSSSGTNIYWSNYCASNDAKSPFDFAFFGANKLGTGYEPKVSQQPRTQLSPIRCQKDEANR